MRCALTRACRPISLIVSFLVINTPVLSSDAADIKQLEKSVVSFSMEGLSLGQTSDQLHQTLTLNGYSLKQKFTRPTGTISNYFRNKNKARANVSITVGSRSQFPSEISIAIAGPDDQSGAIDKIQKVFKGSEQACKQNRNSIVCREFTDTNELVLQARIAPKKAIFKLVNKPSRLAQQRANTQANRDAEVKRREIAAQVREDRKVALSNVKTGSVAASTPSQPGQDAGEAKVVRLPSSHPCLSYDTKNAAQVSACINAMKTARAEYNQYVHNTKYNRNAVTEEERSRWWNAKKDLMGRPAMVGRLMDPNIACSRLADRYKENLEMLGFNGDEVSRRIPDCSMFAKVHQEQYRQAVYWNTCQGEPHPGDIESIKKCILPQMAQSGFVAKWVRIDPTGRMNPPPTNRCREMRGYYLGGVNGARLEPLIGNSSLQAPRCEVFEGIYKPIAEQYVKAEQEKREAALEKQEEYDKQRQQQLFHAYYEETPERRKSKYSAFEHKAMKNGKLTVPAGYPAPTAEEIRLAVMRSIVDRANEEMGAPMVEVMRRSTGVGGSVVTDGHKTYLQLELVGPPLAMVIRFKDVANRSCTKRSDKGYMCRYNLPASASTDQNNLGIRGGPRWTIAKFSADFMSQSSQTVFNNWFVLTEKGWRQPHTKEQEAEIKEAQLRLAENNRRRTSRPNDPDVSMVDNLLQAGSDMAYASGGAAGLRMKRIK